MAQAGAPKNCAQHRLLFPFGSSPREALSCQIVLKNSASGGVVMASADPVKALEKKVEELTHELAILKDVHAIRRLHHA